MCVRVGNGFDSRIITRRKAGAARFSGAVMVGYRTSSERETVDLYSILTLLDAGVSLASSVLNFATQAFGLALPFL